jgi:fatty aldehyde-generating acyl-ACP reductase
MKFLKSFSNYLKDFFVRILPQSSTSKEVYGYAFLVHSRDTSDIIRKFKFLKHFPKYLIEFFTMYSWPITVSSITGLISYKTNKPINGWVIGIPMTARQMIENRSLALKKIIQATKLAKKKGAKIIGLGALTSSLSKGGLDLVDKVDINITTGHAYTAYTVTANLFKLAESWHINKFKVVIAIVGAAGSIGSTSAKLIARAGFMNLILIDLERKHHHFEPLIQEIMALNNNISIQITHKVTDIKSADFIVTATNAPEALIKPDDLKSGAVIIDDAQPSDVSQEVLSREDVLVIEAGVINTPNINNNFNFGLKSKNDNFCCLGEVLILSSQEWNEHYVLNRPTLDLVDEIAELGKHLNFKLADFQNFKESISIEKMTKIKAIVENQYGYN